MTTFTVTYFDAARLATVTYEVDGMTPSDMFAAAHRYIVADHPLTNFDTFENAAEESAAFARYVVDATLDDESGLCDPTISFSTLWAGFLDARTATA